MHKLGLLVAISAVLIATPSVFAASAPGSACKRKRAERSIGLRVHQLPCKAAYKSLTTGAGGYRCGTVGQTRMIPYMIKCVSRKHKTSYYSYEFYGG